MNIRAKAMSLFLLGLVRLLTGAQARWYGCPPKAEQRIYFANHQSHADLVLMWAALPQELRSITRPIAAKDYWTASTFKRWITTEVFNAVYVEREKKGDEDPLQPLIDALDSGDSLILFPEGTRTSDGSLQSAKAGVGFIACKTQVPVVPVRIFGSFEAYGKGRGLHLGTPVSIVYGRPIPPSAYDEPKAGKERAQIASDRIMSEIARLQMPARQVI